jgi:alpha-L-rhamnosidase
MLPMKTFTTALFLLASAALCSMAAGDNALKVTSTTVGEGFVDPVGYHLEDLSFSWKLPLHRNGTAQTAYRITVASSAEKLGENPDVWDSGKVESAQSVKVPYRGPALQSRDRRYWRVKVWDENGREGEWSVVSHFEIGLKDHTEWSGKWIAGELPTAIKEYVFNRTSVPKGKKANYEFMKPAYIRKEFKTPKQVVRARFYATARGIYKASLNGRELDSRTQWIPGWTEYGKRVQTDTYDVTSLIQQGHNAIGILVGDGWYAGQLHGKRKLHKKGWFLGQLEIFYSDGSSEVIPTDQSWRASSGPIVFGDIFDGEDYDANLEMPGWDKPHFDAASWTEPEQQPIDPAVALDPRRNQPVSEIQEIAPVSVKQISEGVFIYDLGQNMVGWPHLLDMPVEKGSVVKLRFGEVLQPDGTLYVDNYRSAISEDTYTPKADERISWEPTLTFHGFRYVEICGLRKGAKPAIENLKGIVIHNEMPATGDFHCSNEKLNRLQKNIQWGQRGNFFSVPMDCPQRDERLGWTGDAQIFAPTSTFNMDVEAFFTKWLVDVNDLQDDRGAYPNVAPYGVKNKGSAGWSDAGIIIPFEMYLAYGNTKIFAEHYDRMKKWIYFLRDHSSKDLIRSGFGFGDWLQPNSVAAKRSGKERGSDCPNTLIGTAYHYRTTLMMERMANALGKDSDAKEFSKLAHDIREAFNRAFVKDDGRIDSGNKNYVESQTAYLVPLAFGLLDEKTSKLAAKHLIRKIEEDGRHLNTGFIGTPILTSVLAQIGEVDLAYELLEKETYPSWLFPIDQGATTMWERWDAYSKEKGIHPARGNSFNHYAYGAIGKWLYASVAGLTYDENKPGYKNIIFAPIPGGSLSHASAWHETPYGRASSSWKISENRMEWQVEIPANATGTLVFPTKKRGSIKVNGEPATTSPMAVESGKYIVTLTL